MSIGSLCVLCCAGQHATRGCQAHEFCLVAARERLGKSRVALGLVVAGQQRFGTSQLGVDHGLHGFGRLAWLACKALAASALPMSPSAVAAARATEASLSLSSPPQRRDRGRVALAADRADDADFQLAAQLGERIAQGSCGFGSRNPLQREAGHVRMVLVGQQPGQGRHRCGRAHDRQLAAHVVFGVARDSALKGGSRRLSRSCRFGLLAQRQPRLRSEPAERDRCPSRIVFNASKASSNISRVLVQEECLLAIRTWNVTRDQGDDRALQLPRLAAGPIDHSIGLGVAREFLLGRVPFQRASQLVGDIAQVADDGRVDGQFDVAERLFARLHALDEVAIDAPFAPVAWARAWAPVFRPASLRWPGCPVFGRLW